MTLLDWFIGGTLLAFIILAWLMVLVNHIYVTRMLRRYCPACGTIMGRKLDMSGSEKDPLWRATCPRCDK